MCCAKSDELPVTVLHGFYVDSLLKKNAFSSLLLKVT